MTKVRYLAIVVDVNIYLTGFMETSNCPSSSDVISKFRFSLPCSKVNGARKLEKDEDGDYILERGVPHGIIESTIVLGEVNLKTDCKERDTPHSE